MRAQSPRATLRLPQSSLRIQVVADPRDACRGLSREVARLAAEHPALVLGLATGNTPISFYAELVTLHAAGELDLSGATSFNLDEYEGLAADHPSSFSRYMRERLFDSVPFAATHLPTQAAGYEEEIRAAGGLDWQLLGIGINGHVAFNEPGSARDSRTRRVKLSAETRKANAHDFPPGEAPATHAITVGVATILEARRLRVLAFGAHKARIVRHALLEPMSPQLPASFLREHPDIELWLDRPAAAELEEALEKAGESR